VAVGEDDAVLAVNQPGTLPVEDRPTGARPAWRRLSLLTLFLLLTLEKLAVLLRQLVEKRAANPPACPRLARHAHHDNRLGNALGHLDKRLVELLGQLESLRWLGRPDR